MWGGGVGCGGAGCGRVWCGGVGVAFSEKSGYFQFM